MTDIDPAAQEYIPAAAASTYVKLARAYGEEYYKTVARIVTTEGPEDGTTIDRVLDVGTGPGGLALELAESTDVGHVDAFDYTVELVSAGRRAAARRGLLERVSFFAADCYAIPTAARTYDALTCTGVLHALEDPAAALAEFHRVLCPGGVALVFDPTILEVPENPDVDFTAHERQVFEAYGVRGEDEEAPVSLGEAKQLARESPLEIRAASLGRWDDVRLVLERLPE